MPLLDGRHVRYINLDNAASTPALRSVVDTIEEFLPYYSGVHRGTGYKSRLSTAVFEQAREIVGQFVGADPDRDVVVFTKNTTEAINKVAHTLRLHPDAVVVTTGLEHHSNELPWRSRTHTERVAVGPTARSTSTTSIGSCGSTPVDAPCSPCRAPPTSRASCSRSTSWRQRSTPSAAGSWSTPPNWPPTAGSTCGATTIPVTSTSW